MPLFQVQAAVQQVQNIISRCLTIHDKLEASLRDLSRSGDVQASKAARKAFDGLLKDLSKELKPLLAFLQSSPQAAPILPKVCCLFFAAILHLPLQCNSNQKLFLY
jgi:oligosaccharyltransferase complex subunit alpha (ribophorin I)